MKTLRLSLAFAACLLAFQGMSQDKFVPCTAKMPRPSTDAKIEDTAKDSKPRSMFDNYYLWPTGKVLKVKFLSGSKFLQDKVKAAAKQWENYANITFDFVEYGDAHIRVLLGQGLGHNSVIGILNNSVPSDQQTMNLDTTNFYRYGMFIDKSLNRTATHEFGHALGFLHEHMSPISGIKWNKEVVYESLKKTDGWDRATVDFNLFKTYNLMYTNGTKYDPKSIMHYAVDKTWTTDGYGVDWNYEMSDGDKEGARLAYPRGERTTVEVPQYTVTNFTGITVEDDPLLEGFKLYPSFHINTSVRDCKVQIFCFVMDETGKNLPIKDKPGYVVAPNAMYNLSATYDYYTFNKTTKQNPFFLAYSSLPTTTSTKFKVKVVVKLIDGNEVKDIYWSAPTAVNMVRSSKSAGQKNPASTKDAKTTKPANKSKTN